MLKSGCQRPFDLRRRHCFKAFINTSALITCALLGSWGCADRYEPSEGDVIGGELYIPPNYDPVEPGGAQVNPVLGGMSTPSGGAESPAGGIDGIVPVDGGMDTPPTGGDSPTSGAAGGGDDPPPVAGSMPPPGGAEVPPPAPTPSTVELLTDSVTSVPGVKLRNNPYRRPVSIYSVRVSQLTQGERLFINGEVTLSRCNQKDINGTATNAATSPCNTQEMRDAPYTYQPWINTAIFISQSSDDLGDEPPRGEWVEKRCDEARHQCPLTLPQLQVDDLPPGDYWVHIGATAHANGNNVESWHYMEVKMDKGQLNVARLKASNDVVQTLSTQTVQSTGRLRVDQGSDRTNHVAYELPLSQLQGGDVLWVKSGFASILDGTGDCDPMINTGLFLSDHPGETDPARGIGTLAPSNGMKCPKYDAQGCNYKKQGAIKLPAQLATPIYLVHHATANRGCADNEFWSISASTNGMTLSVLR